MTRGGRNEKKALVGKNQEKAARNERVSEEEKGKMRHFLAVSLIASVAKIRYCTSST